MPSASALVIGAQGTFGIINGIYGLLPSGNAANAQLLSISSPAAVEAIALGSITIGAFYVNAAAKLDRPVMWATIVGRVAGVLTFWRHGGAWKNVAVFEAICGASAAVALLFDGWRDSRQITGNSSRKDL